MRELSSAEVLEVAGTTEMQLRDWCQKGTIKPAGGRGRGNHRKFSVLQTVGIAVSIELRNSDRGCSADYMRRVISAFATVTEEELLQAFENRTRYFELEHNGRVLLHSEKYPGCVDVQKNYKQIEKQIKRMSKTEPNPTGRNRGLVGNK
jgi:DNA-binding transcriptional MerR regulator